ncbi:mycofactocin-coupled SDR family oxidoreductase [Pseudonocardia pini]|uniref:mycofactocin-coupled SDR family oxidoreductase n=1 Tax=Pseudonocardia pini TaxID=2758030 RepID=UPI0015F021A8|nr:mycofactocin-coupled SDR family oxidoreductase [Pseudonocardia pini]
MNRLQGKIALVTGAGHGQGRSHAVRMAEEGADLILVDVGDQPADVSYPMATAAELDETVKLVEAHDRRVHVAHVDVRDREGLTAAVAAGATALGGLDVVSANAGVCFAESWDTADSAVWETTLGINMTGVWNTCLAALPHLVERGGGSIVITSSYAGVRGAPFLAAYTASKHGVVGLMRSLALELAEHAVRVNTVHPTGVSDTFMAGAAPLFPLLEKHPKLGSAYVNALDVQTVEPVDISNAVVFLASDESRYITGLELKVDAGVSL